MLEKREKSYSLRESSSENWSPW